ncbi:unnamed protein product [Rotaria socialis]|uniref:MAM domain-containing protein n=1 Tax=Rotaria socialis TaxID=392032 RepID=A0A820X474_9BILA|nr:unnamed protein product [Rotaria socialis]
MMAKIQQLTRSLVVKIVLLYYLTINNHGSVCPTVTCNFEIDECNWKLNSTWKMYPSGSTPDTASSGPTMDHTTGNGNYARFMARVLSESDRFGVMNTSTSLSQPAAFSFWYFMHGNQIGTLGLMVNDQTLWEKTSRQGLPVWHQANVTLPMGADINIKFVANRTGSGRSSDIAIDDIVLQGEAISISTRTPRPISTTTPRTRYNASCDFDVNKELCGWKSDTNYGWKVIRQREVNSSIGPSSDYSSIMRSNVDNKLCQIPYDEKGPQYYCIINLKRNRCKGSDNKWIDCRDGGFVQIQSGEFDQAGERSQFDSPILDALSDEGCVQFHYNIAGSDNDELNVYVEDYWSGRKSCMWHKNGPTVPNRWIPAEAPLKLKKDEKYKIVFEARKGTTGGTGLVSLDHIIVSSKACSGTYPVEECPFEEVTTSTANIMITSDNPEMITTEMDTTVDTSTSTIFIETTVTTSTSIATTTTTTTSTTSTTSTTTTSTTTSTTTTTTSTTSTTTTTATTTTTSTTSTTTTTSINITAFQSTIATTKVDASTTPTLTSENSDMISFSLSTSDLVTSEMFSTTTTSSTYVSTFATNNNTDIEGQESTTSPVSPKKSLFLPIFLGLLAVVLIILIVTGYIKRDALCERVARRSNTSETTATVYLDLSEPDGYVRFDNNRDRSSSA